MEVSQLLCLSFISHHPKQPCFSASHIFSVVKRGQLTLHCSLKTLMVGHGGSSAGSYLTDPTSPIPSHCASIVATSTVRVNSHCQGHVPWAFTTVIQFFSHLAVKLELFHKQLPFLEHLFSPCCVVVMCGQSTLCCWLLLSRSPPAVTMATSAGLGAPHLSLLLTSAG